MCFCSFESCKARGVHYFEKIQILYAQGFCVSRFFHFAFPLFEDISEPACGASLAAVSGASCNRARIVPKEERGRGGLKGTIFLLFLYHIQKICQADTISEVPALPPDVLQILLVIWYQGGPSPSW